MRRYFGAAGMPIKDPEILKLVAEQTAGFNSGAPENVKVAILKKIQQAQMKRKAEGKD